MRDVWAIGDLTGEPMLAHRAMAQGAMVAEIIAGQRAPVRAGGVPAICFTDPEIVSVGLSPDEAAESRAIDASCRRFPFAANGRAMTLDATKVSCAWSPARDDQLVVGAGRPSARRSPN